MKKIFILFALFSLVSCANHSHNLIEQSEIKFRGGAKANRMWDDALNFERTSWYYGVLMLYDAYLYRVDKNSPFYSWFSATEKETIDACSDFLVSIIYGHDAQRVSDRMFLNEMEKNGYEETPILEFAYAMKSHPDYVKWHLHHYAIKGLCYKVPRSDKPPIVINFPGFQEAQVNF